MRELAPWMLIVLPICALYLVMIVLWIVACKKTPNFTLYEPLPDHGTGQRHIVRLEREAF